VVDDEPDLEMLILQKFRREMRDGRFAFHFGADPARYSVADGCTVRLLSLPVLNPRASDFGTSLAAAC
jgi:hypothetical protein